MLREAQYPYTLGVVGFADAWILTSGQNDRENAGQNDAREATQNDARQAAQNDEIHHGQGRGNARRTRWTSPRFPHPRHCFGYRPDGLSDKLIMMFLICV